MDHTQQIISDRIPDKLDESTKNNGTAPPTKTHPLRQALPQVLATAAKNILLLGYGMTLGFPTIVIPNIIEKEDIFVHNSTTQTGMLPKNYTDPYNLVLTKTEISWFSSINLICVPLGCALSGFLTQPFGRKPSMIGINIPFIIAWLIYHYSSSVGMLYAAVALTGFSGGLLEAPVLTYVAEITTPQLRGMLSATASMVTILGIFVQFILGNFIRWRTIALLNVMFPIIAICCLCAVPESPHWLIGKGRLKDAEKSLQWLRGWVKPFEVQIELSQIVKSVESSKTQEKKEKPSWDAFCQKTFIQPYILVSMVFLIGHFCGMTTLQTYAVSIFVDLGTPIDKYLATLILGLVQLLGALACVILVHWTGKRPIALVSLIGSGICFSIVAFFAKFNVENEMQSWIPVIFLVVSAFMTHMCIRLLPWILIGEVYPLDVRATASGASASIGYLFGFIANKSFFKIVDTIELSGTFCFNALVCFLGALYLYYRLPETEGRALYEIENHFAGIKFDDIKNRKRKEGLAVENPALEHSESNL